MERNDNIYDAYEYANNWTEELADVYAEPWSENAGKYKDDNREIFPKTIFAAPEFDGPTHNQVMDALEERVEEYDCYTQKEQKMIKELLQLVSFSDKTEMHFLSPQSPAAWALKFEKVFLMKKNSNEMIYKLLTRNKISSEEAERKYPRTFEALVEGEVSKNIDLVIDFIRKELAVYPKKKDIAHIIKAYCNHQDLIGGMRRIETIKENIELPTAKTFWFGTEEGEANVYKVWLDEWNPKKIVEFLDKEIIGQREAKITMALVVFQHMRRLANPDKPLKNNSCLLYGPSGSGKTFLVTTLAKILPVKVLIIDASAFSPSGYQGAEVSEMLTSICTPENQGAIIFLDEFDKLLDGDRKGTKLVGTSAKTQSGFLKILDGEGNLNIGKNTIDISRYLIIFAGAFDEIYRKKKQEINSRTIGFLDLSSPSHSPQRITDEDFRETYEILPELLGRITYRASCKKLEVEDYYHICKLENGAVEELKDTYRELGVGLDIKEDAFWALAQHAFKSDMGARFIRRSLYECVKFKIFDSSYDEEEMVVITAEDIENYFLTH